MLMKTAVEEQASDDALYSLIEQYAKAEEPILVDFRKLVTGVTFGARATHLIHTYPAKLLPHIPYFFLSNNILSEPDDHILDAFCGSGTVLLESLLAGRNAYGIDANPLARLIAKVKTTRLDICALRKSATRLESRISSSPVYPPPDVINIDYWFYPHVIKQLSSIREAIERTRNQHFRDFYRVCFSNCVKKVSLADANMSVPVRLKAEKYPKGHKFRELAKRKLRRLKRVNVKKEFFKILSVNIKRLSSYVDLVPENVHAEIIGEDARKLSLQSTKPSNNYGVNLIITSPPYAGAQKYIRASSLGLGWLGMCKEQSLKNYESQNIGREHYRRNDYRHPVVTGIDSADRNIERIFKKNPLRSHIAGQYLVEMRESFESMSTSLVPGGYLVLVAANNKVCGHDFSTQEYLQSIIESLGFEPILRLIDNIHSRGLMTKRNKTASVIASEWVLVFRKNR